MNCSRTEISIIFDEPFWIALFERFEEGYYSVAREVIGTSEPSGAEIKAFFGKLNVEQLRYTIPLKESARVQPKSYKFQQRQIRKATDTSLSKHVFTKVLLQLKLQREKTKLSNNSKIHKIIEFEKQAKFRQHQLKKKEMLRGHWNY